MKATAEPGKPVTVNVVESSHLEAQHEIKILDEHQINEYLKLPVASAALRSALQDLLKRKTELKQISEKRNTTGQSIQELVSEQQRLRSNLESSKSVQSLTQRYSQKLADSEDQIETLRTLLAKETANEATMLRTYLDFCEQLAAE